jgi:transcriptional regulator with XRE-family HTH domain
MKQENPIGYAMRRYRLDNNLNQKEMSEALEISQQQYSVLERGMQDPTLEFIKKFKSVTGINLLADGPPLMGHGVDKTDAEKNKSADLKATITEKNEYIKHLIEENAFLRMLIAKGGVSIDKVKPTKKQTR